MHVDCMQVQAALDEQRKRALKVVEEHQSRVEALAQELISKQVRQLPR
jgi:ATP-dependent Zn protease